MSKIKAGEAYVEITVEGAGRAEIALGKIQQTANAVNVSVKKLAASFAALNNLFAFGFRHISTFSAEFGKTGDVFDKASARLGISATALSEYDYAAQRCGASLGDARTPSRISRRNSSRRKTVRTALAKRSSSWGCRFPILQDCLPSDNLKRSRARSVRSTIRH